MLASFKAFLFKIARNGVIDAMRKQWRSPVFEDYLKHCDEVYTNGEEVTQSLDFDYILRQLKAAKDKLTPWQREIFELRKDQRKDFIIRIILPVKVRPSW